MVAINIPAVLILFVCFVGCFSELEHHFMDCSGNRPKWWNLLRRCCDSPELPKGCQCFDVSRSKTDFTNSMYHLPECPEDLGVVFYFYDQDNLETSITIKAGQNNIESTPFKSERPTVLLAHGFMARASSRGQITIKDELLAEQDVNVIIVDWEEGAKGPNYYQAVANTRTVGALTGRLLEDINTFSGASFESIHLVGHSLGAHVMGYAGKEVFRLTGQKIGRITGLDPAGPQFESYSYYVRLDAEDASFVDIIHTDGESLISSGFGTRYSIGHVDFYANGGSHQPACPEETGGLLVWLDFEDTSNKGACSHMMAIYYFANSISKCRYDPPVADGATCTMGYHVSPSCRGDYHPTTTAEEPFC